MVETNLHHLVVMRIHRLNSHRDLVAFKYADNAPRAFRIDNDEYFDRHKVGISRGSDLVKVFRIPRAVPPKPTIIANIRSTHRAPSPLRPIRVEHSGRLPSGPYG